MFFADRVEAGRLLAERLRHLQGQDLVVLGLARGGVVVAAEVAAALGAPLDVVVVRKLGVPFQPELGMGAIGEDGVRVINYRVVALAGLGERDVTAVEEGERVELEQRARRFRGEREPTPAVGRIAVVVDDGIATGSTAIAGCRVARARGARRVVLAIPVAPPGWATTVGDAADETVCLSTPSEFAAVGQFYRDFSQTSDEEVIDCLDRHAGMAPRRRSHRAATSREPIDPHLQRAADEAAGMALFADPFADEMLIAERETAEGTELFEDADAVIPVSALREGSPGHEMLTGDLIRPTADDDESPDRGDEEYGE